MKVSRREASVTSRTSWLVELIHSDVQTPVNLGNPDERTILEPAEFILELTDSNSDIVYKPRPPQDPQQRCPDISKATEELGWEPNISLQDGLKQTIAYFVNNR